MKATYNKPLMATEEINKVDVITASGLHDVADGGNHGAKIAGHIKGRG